MYDRTKVLREDGILTSETKKEVRASELVNLCAEWREFLERPNTPGEWTKMAIVPRLEAWLSRDPGSSMSYYMTQVFTGHGCFSKYLYRIGKRVDTSCDFCEEDDAIHTIKDCPMWDTQRISLKEKLGLARDFTLGDIVEAIVGSRDHWNAFSAFVQEAMRDKEEEGRRRERERNRASSSSSF